MPCRPKTSARPPEKVPAKTRRLNLGAPKDDEKKHPQSSAAVANAEDESLSDGGVTELHTWDPHKAAKDIEVGDFYYKRKNYRAAEARYRDALLYKNDDAMATIRLATCLEKLGILDDARAEYQSYLRILPHGLIRVKPRRPLPGSTRRPESSRLQSSLSFSLSLTLSHLLPVDYSQPLRTSGVRSTCRSASFISQRG